MTNEHKQDGKTLRLPDGRLMGYAEYGERGGIPLLAIHGTPGSRLMMQPAHEIARAKGIWLIALDRPGYGLSTSCPDYTLAQWGTDIKVLLDVLKVDRFLLFGVSGGGPYASAIAALLPKRVRAVALVSPVGVFDEAVRQKWSRRHALFFSTLPRVPRLMKLAFQILRLFVLYAPRPLLNIFTRTLGKADHAIFSDTRHLKQLLMAFQEGFRNGVDGALYDLELFSSRWQLPFERAVMPIILWQGMTDPMVPPLGAIRLANSLPNVELIRLENEGHFWIFDHVDEVLERLKLAARD
jgi:pimeloyl-ACP methyl ester carboxylesterase